VNVTNADAGASVIDGLSNATLSFIRGNRYNINVNASGHPFWIQTVAGGYSSGNIYNTGITNNGTDNGTIVFDVQANAPQLFYVCQYHSSMNGSISVSNPIQDLSGSARLFVSGDLSSGGKLFVFGSTYVGGNVSASGRLFVNGASAISGKFYVGQGMSIGSDLSASGRLFLAADASLNRNLAISKKAVVGGDVTSKSRLFVGKNLTVGGNLTAYSGAISKPTTITMPSVTTPTFDLTKGATFYFAPTSAGNFTAAFVNVPTAVNQTFV
jgi:cytoskeletal protein CcmA (bactofilin family)